MFKALFTSKKFIAALAGVVVSLVSVAGLELPTDAVAAVLAPVMAYIVGQGIADNGKEAAKVAATQD